MDLASKRVVVMGLGRFGGGVGVTRYCVERGADVLVTDKLEESKLAQSLPALADLNVRYRLGRHEVEDFTNAGLVIANPAVSPMHDPYLRAATGANVPITTEVRIFIENLPRPRAQVVGVTGTAGKSTTTAMVGHVLRETHQNKVWVGGNLGGSLLDKLGQIGGEDTVVLELSSFMLYHIDRVAWSPHVAVVTGFSPNHLDWHGGVEEYARCKQAILEHQGAGDFAVIGPVPREYFKPRTSRVAYLDGLSTYRDPHGLNLLLPGEHNRANARLAIEACAALGVERHRSTRALTTFRGLPHRLQFVLEHHDVRYYNDSKSTTPEAAILAMRCFERGTVHAILGGYDKQSDLEPMARVARAHCRAVYTLGHTGGAIATMCENADGGAQVVRCGTLDAAMQQIVTRVCQGDTVLLSPGCASWDQFDNYEARGAAFASLALAVTGEGSPPAPPG
ncbi:MAG: UDP-N-acetylmuramoyl-L-alanine--D-glutamate ligase [Phycisphaera sp.]|nr:UDP-N-acetylmuramoyl-L-alanine--D-glutamate ligase [Phycisphaera sp.]